MSVQNLIGFGSSDVELQAAPIRPDWILEGAPVGRNKFLSGSVDGGAFTLLWDCTAGVFNWYYDIDETIYVIEGSVVVRADHGEERRLGPGDTAFFPAGSHALWRVENYVRKVAFFHSPLPAPLRFAEKGMRRIKRIANGGKNREPAMFRAEG